MSRLSRLRSFWRSLRRGTVRDGSYRPHAAVNLLPTEYRDTGGLRTDGSWVLSASTGTRALSMQTQATATSAATSSFWLLGDQWGDDFDQTSRVRVNRPTGPGASGIAMELPGASGAPLPSAD